MFGLIIPRELWCGLTSQAASHYGPERGLDCHPESGAVWKGCTALCQFQRLQSLLSVSTSILIISFKNPKNITPPCNFFLSHWRHSDCLKLIAFLHYLKVRLKRMNLKRVSVRAAILYHIKLTTMLTECLLQKYTEDTYFNLPLCKHHNDWQCNVKVCST